MGTVLEVTLEAPDEAAGQAAIDACFALGSELERIFTTFDPASPTQRLNASAGGGPFPAPQPLIQLLRVSKTYAEQTQGAFDVTVGPLVALWREAARADRWPSPGALAEARQQVGWQRIQIGAEGVRLAAGMSVDFGGIAKGWALDRMGELLQARGIRSALLNFGGSSLLGMGAPSDAPGWRVLVTGGPGGVVGSVLLRDRSLSVSASLGQFREIQGRRVGHVIDPRSGEPLLRGTLSAVLAPRGDLAEALSTALLVLSPEEGLALVERTRDTEALLVDEVGGRRKSSGFAASSGFVPLERPSP